MSVQSRDLSVGESARLTGRPTGGVNGAVGEYKRRNQIVGCAFRSELVHDREIGQGSLFGEPQADRGAGIDYAPHRAATKVWRLESLEGANTHIHWAPRLP